MYGRILPNNEIQISDDYIEGYHEIVEEDPPIPPSGYMLNPRYVIIDNTIYRTYVLVEIPPNPTPEDPR